MAQSIEVDEITFVSPNGTKATMKLRDDGMVQFGPDGGARRMVDVSGTTSASSQTTDSSTDDSGD